MFSQDNLHRGAPLADFTIWWLRYTTRVPKLDRSRITNRLLSPSASSKVYKMGIILSTSQNCHENYELGRVKL